jgi:tryptophan synthase beta subunit
MVDSNRYAMTAINKTRFGICRGQFIPETLVPAIKELTAGRGCCEDNFAVKWFEA